MSGACLTSGWECVHRSGGGGSEFLDCDLLFCAEPIFEFVALCSAARLIQIRRHGGGSGLRVRGLGVRLWGRWEFLWGIGIHGGILLEPNVRLNISSVNCTSLHKIGAARSVHCSGMAVTVDMQNTGDPVVRTEIITLIEHVLGDRQGDWRVSIIGSQGNDRWEMPDRRAKWV